MVDVMICDRGAVLDVDGARVRLIRNLHTAHRDSRIVAEHPDLWREMPVHFDADWEPPRRRAPAPAPAKAPSTKAVRTWATAQGIEVPARGKIPDDVVAAYMAEHGQG